MDEKTNYLNPLKQVEIAYPKSLEDETASAIETLLISYKDRKKGLRLLSKKMGVHEKTINRILNKENKPSYQTVFKIYRTLFNEYNDSKVLDLAPEAIKNFLIKQNPQSLTSEKNYSHFIDKELQKNPIVSEIFTIIATGAVTLDQIEYRFGKYGLDLLNKMLEKDLLQEVQKNVFILGKNQPIFTGETILSFGQAMINGHAKPNQGEELDNNFISFYAEGLSESAYQEWLRIDHDAYKRKFELTRDARNLGPIRSFTFMITEKIELLNLH